MLSPKKVFCLCFFSVLTAVGSAQTAPKAITNADIVKMVKAELPESTVLLTIQASPHAFDTAPEALIQLKADGVPSKVIEAMLQAGAPGAAPAAVPAAAPVAPSNPMDAAIHAGLWGAKQTRVEVDRVFLIDGETRTDMKYTQPSTRTRFNPFGGTQQFAVLNGTRAAFRIKNRKPVFKMILPSNVQPSSVLALARLGERPNGSREILIGGGYMSFSAGLPKDRNVPINIEKAADQSEAPEGYELFEITPGTSLLSAEYSFMVVKAGPGASAGIFGMGSSANYNFYEFAVD